VEHGMISSK